MTGQPPTTDDDNACACCADGEPPMWARGRFWHTTDSPYAPGGLADECQNWAVRAAAADTLAHALREIHETADWYAKNGDRLAHEVDHCLCVEIPSMALDALAVYDATAAAPGDDK